MNDGPLRAVVRIEDASLFGHAIVWRRQLFERWLRFVRYQAATVLAMTGENDDGDDDNDDAVAVSRSRPLVGTRSRRQQQQKQQQQPYKPHGIIPAHLRVRTHKRVFEFAKSVLQLTPPLPDVVPAPLAATSLHRLSRHVGALAERLGVSTKDAQNSPANGAACLVVWWSNPSSVGVGSEGSMCTYDWHPAFESSSGRHVDDGSSSAVVAMAHHTAERFQRACVRVCTLALTHSVLCKDVRAVKQQDLLCFICLITADVLDE